MLGTQPINMEMLLFRNHNIENQGADAKSGPELSWVAGS